MSGTELLWAFGGMLVGSLLAIGILELLHWLFDIPWPEYKYRRRE